LLPNERGIAGFQFRSTSSMKSYITLFASNSKPF
jgi:hypothetical protein